MPCECPHERESLPFGCDVHLTSCTKTVIELAWSVRSGHGLHRRSKQTYRMRVGGLLTGSFIFSMFVSSAAGVGLAHETNPMSNLRAPRLRNQRVEHSMS
jgi:hypothetical protein